MSYYMDLIDANNLIGIIVLCDSGVIYNNQVAGVSCQQCQAEGAFIPADLTKTGNPPHDDDNCMSINSDDFDDYLYNQDSNSPLYGWRVDRTKYSVEAWVHVFNGEHKGILTYTNCD